MSYSPGDHALFVCMHASEFPAQALLRLRPDLQSQHVVVLEGCAPHEYVCAMNSHARKRGASMGMTRLEAEGLDGLCILSRSFDSEAAARNVFLECAAQFSPRIEETSEATACAFVLDISGTERLFGAPARLAERLRASLATAGFRASIAAGANFNAVRMKAAATRGITVIPVGEEASALAKLSLAALCLDEDYHETFVLWGIRTLGELAVLPEVELVTRLGPDSRRWRELARGAAEHTFQPIEASFALKEFIEFEDPVEQMDSLLFVGANMIDSMVLRASGRALSLASLTMQMKLEGNQTYEQVIRPALPSTDRKFLLKLLQLEIAAHPPPSAVLAFALSAEAGQSGKIQLGLFAPQTPEPSRLDVTLARLKALVGYEYVGSPVLEDTHRSNSFRIERFTTGAQPTELKFDSPRTALRRMRPPATVRVWLNEMRPTAFRDNDNRYEVTAAYGPWRTSGSWWSTDGWDTEEWDVLAACNDGESIGCLLVLDRTKNRWQLEAFYD